MLDTSTCIDVVRSRSAAYGERFRDAVGTMSISSIVLTELLVGAEKSRDPVRTRRTVDNLTSRLEILPFDASAASHVAQIRSQLERVGMMIGSYDCLIAGHARSRGLIVVTANTREFERVPGVVCENWR